MRLTSLAAAAGLALAGMSAHAQQAIVREAPLRAHLSFLADDLLEGRGTGQRGGDLAVRYLETQAALMGLKPLADGSYRQPVRFEGAKLLPGSSVAFYAGGNTRFTPIPGQGIVYGNGNGKASVNFEAPLVFVGYGVTAEEENWDDYKGLDVKGKVLIMMVNDPQPTADEPNRFAGKAYTYYGRWLYKFEEAARRGAAGVLLIHTTPSASYPPRALPPEGRGQRLRGLAAGGHRARAHGRVRLRPRRTAPPRRAA
jgi:hypothetical protein